ncbi:MAG: leucyl/phenylalanyl-tRNA--protein transferase [Parvibaculum sp.]
MDIIDPDILLRAYAYGVFPMGESAGSSKLYWVDPEERGLLPLDRFHIPKRLQRTIRSDPFVVTVDTCFRRVMEACATETDERKGTWINEAILDAYTILHERGAAHSVECWQDGELVGGLYGVSLGKAFFGESMFSRTRDASKIALVHLVGRLIAGGFTLLDTQFVTDHLAQFGAIEVPRETYKARLHKALQGDAGDFYSLGATVSGSDILQSINQTS